MPALTDIARYKRLAELFVHAMKVDPLISARKNSIAHKCLLVQGLTERQAEKFLTQAFNRYDRNMLRSAEQTVHDVALIFRTREHGFILEQLQLILEADDVTDRHQEFYDLCYSHLFHG